MKNSNDTTGNRTRDLPAFSIVPQPTAPPLAPLGSMIKDKLKDDEGDGACRMHGRKTIYVQLFYSKVVMKETMWRT